MVNYDDICYIFACIFVVNGSGAFVNSVGTSFEEYMTDIHAHPIKLTSQTAIAYLLDKAQADMNSYLNDYAVAAHFASTPDENITRGLFNYEILHSPGLAINAIDNSLFK